MRFLTLSVGCVVVWCLLCESAFCQQANGAGAAESPGGTSSPAGANPADSADNAGTTAGNNTPTSPGTDGTSGVANSPNSSPTAAGTQPLSGAQPGQTGSMESQRLNALNQEYQNQQQREFMRNQPRIGQQGSQNDINQLAPSGATGTTRAFRGGPALGDRANNQPPLGSRGAPGSRGNAWSGTRTFDRGLVIEGLREFSLPAAEWRVVSHNGRWWYYTTDKTWMYYGNDGWVLYPARDFRRDGIHERRDVSYPVGYPADDWRLVFHNGRWWFWTPNQTWMYYRDGRWNDLRAPRPIAGRSKTTERYGVGYRGLDEGTKRSQQPMANPATDPANNPPLPSQMAPDPTTDPMKSQDEASVNIDAQN